MDDTESRNPAIPYNVLDPLFVASETSDFKKALQCLIETAKTPNGRLDLVSKHIFLPALEVCRYPSKLSAEDIFLSVKLLRNLCAGEIENQNLFIEQNGVEIIWALVTSLGLISEPDNGTMLPLVLQLLGNVSLAGEKQCSGVWRKFFPHRFLDIAKVRRMKTCDPLSMVIYTCSEGSNERYSELFAEPGQDIVVEIIQTVAIAGFRQHWVKLLLSKFCIEGSNFQSIFSKLPQAVETGYSSERAFLMDFLSEILNEQLGDIIVSNDFSLYIFEIFKSAVGNFDFSKRGKLHHLPTGSFDTDVIGYTLSILRDISANDSKEEDPVDDLVATGLIKFLIDLLRELEPPEMIRKTMVTESAKNESASQQCYKYCCPYIGFRRDLVAVIGNCSYRRKHVQDEIREQDGILSLLQQCVSDDDNPFLREWGIWSMRNILEANAENQQLVSDLEVQKSVDCPEIAGLGLKVEINPKTCRPKLVNAS